MKIIHCSDLHLDSKLQTNFTQQQAHRRNHEILLSFERMVRFAEENSVSIVLLCGDIFDSTEISQKTEAAFLDIINRYPKIQFLYLRGNHDRHTFSDNTLPENLKSFGDQWKYYRCKNIVIAGIEITENNADNLYDTLSLSARAVNIVMLHGQTSSENGTDKIQITRLANKNIDYLALGHIHSYQINRLDYRGIYCYSGCLEGRGFDEIGNKGFVLLDINDNSIQSHFIPFATRQFHKIQVDISNFYKITDILQKIRTECSAHSENDYFKIILSGINSAGAPIDCEFLQTILEPELFYVSIEDNSSLKFSYENDSENLLRNEFLTLVYADDTLSDIDKDTIVRIGLAAMNGEDLNI